MPLDYRNRNKNFKQTSHYIIYERAGNRCEGCGVPNCAVGHWETYTRLIEGQPHIDHRFVPVSGPLAVRYEVGGELTYSQAQAFARLWNFIRQAPRVLTIKLQCAHLDHSERNDAHDNLRAYCQRCHRHHDSQDNAARRMYGQKGQHRHQLTLFNDIPYAIHPDTPRPQRPQHPPKRPYRRRGTAGHRPATSLTCKD